MKKILFPTDFSECSKKALVYATHLVRDMGGQLDIVNVYNVPYADPSSVPFEYIQKMLDEKEEVVKEKLKDFIADSPEEYISSAEPVYGIFIAKEVIEVAQEKDHDFILMGTKSEHGRMEKILGSVTTQTMMHATCPVLAIPESAEFNGIKQIAYATDFLPSDEFAVGKLSQMAERFDAKIHFVHINTDGKKSRKEQEFRIEHYPLTFSDFSVINSDSLVQGLDQFIEENRIDLLSMFVPHRRLWERLFHASFTKKMVFHSDVPLLVFHE